MKFGRKPRAFNQNIPHWSKLPSTKMLAPPPPRVDYTQVLPPFLGMFGNSALGDCTIAACFHALQCWSANSGAGIDTESEQDAILAYEEACGYIPGQPNTDNGGVEQDVLTYWLNTGLPIGPSGNGRQLLTAFVEIDQRDLTAVKQAIQQGGLVYLGFEVPNFFNVNSSVWDVAPGADNSIVAGHAVVAAGYDDITGRFKVISWGRLYEMTYAFFARFVDEAYFLANQEWIEATGVTPAGLSLADLEWLMQALKWGEGQARFKRRRHRRMKRQKGLKPQPSAA